MKIADRRKYATRICCSQKVQSYRENRKLRSIISIIVLVEVLPHTEIVNAYLDT